MTAAKEIARRVDALGSDRIFSISDLDLPADWWSNIKVKLGRMVKDGTLVKITNGRYYRPRTSILGPVPPSTEELVKDILYDNGKLVGYLTDYSIWDSMGLTSQFSSTIFIGLNRRKDPTTRDGRKIRFVLQLNEINEQNVHLLQILDTIKFIKKIPDTTIEKTISRLKEIFTNLEYNEFVTLAELSRKYPPRVRAIAGAIMEAVGKQDIAASIKNSLNPLTEYRIGIEHSILPTLSNWNIV